MWRCTFIYIFIHTYIHIYTPRVNLRYGRNYWIYDSFSCLKYLQKQRRGNQVSDTVKCFMFGECGDVTINGASGAGTEKAMAPHSSTLAWKIPWMEEPGGLQSMGLLKSDTTKRLHFHFSRIGEGNGNPHQCSCLENPRDGGAWWAASMGSHRVEHDWSDLQGLEWAVKATEFLQSSSFSLKLLFQCFRYLFHWKEYILLRRQIDFINLIVSYDYYALHTAQYIHGKLICTACMHA